MNTQLIAGSPARADKHPDYPAKPHVLLIFDDELSSPIICQVFPSESDNSVANSVAWDKALLLANRIDAILRPK